MAGECCERRDPHGALGLCGDVGAQRDAQQRCRGADPPRCAGRERVVETHRERLARRLREVGCEARAAREPAAGGRGRRVGRRQADAGEMGRERVERDAADGCGRRAEQPERDDAARSGDLREAATAAGGREIGDHRAIRTLAIRRETSAGFGTNWTPRRERPSPTSSVP